jgi:hypothetical protein
MNRSAGWSEDVQNAYSWSLKKNQVFEVLGAYPQITLPGRALGLGPAHFAHGDRPYTHRFDQSEDDKFTHRNFYEREFDENYEVTG